MTDNPFARITLGRPLHLALLGIAGLSLGSAGVGVAHRSTIRADRPASRAESTERLTLGTAPAVARGTTTPSPLKWRSAAASDGIATAAGCELFVAILNAPAQIDTIPGGYPPATVRIRYGYRRPAGSSGGACLLVSSETTPLRVTTGRKFTFVDHSASFQIQPVTGAGAPQWEATGAIQLGTGTHTLTAAMEGEDEAGYRTVTATHTIVASNVLAYNLAIATATVPAFAEPGSQQPISFQVTNTGYNGATIQFTCEAPSGGNCISVQPTSLTLAPGASGSVAAQALLPSNASAAHYRMKAFIHPPTNVGYAPEAYATAQIATRPLAVTSIAYTGGERVERSLCPIVGAGPGSAVQCGDLVYAHTFPAYRSRNKPRALTLLYNSATADVRPVVALDHSTAQGAEATRFTVDVWRITPGGDQPLVVKHFDNAAAPSDRYQVRRMVVPIDAHALGLGSGAYPIKVQVTRHWSSGSEASLPVTGTLLVVNRRRSAWGSGWWPAGVERLHLGQAGGEHAMLEDADGSAALFRKENGQFVAPPGEYSALASDGAGGYVRTLPGKRVRVYYDGAGLMTRVTQQEQAAVSAHYYWSPGHAGAPQVDSIKDAAGIVTTFVRGSNDRVAAIHLPHTAPVALQHGTSSAPLLLRTIVDPDGHPTAFDYDTSTTRMQSSDARATDTHQYEYDAVGRVARVLTPLHASDPLTARHFSSWQRSGAPVPGRTGTSSSDLAPAARTDSVAFHSWQRIPRTGESEAESRVIFFPHFTGAPTLVHAEGANTTHFERDSVGQATRIRTRSGGIVEQDWDARGRIRETRQHVNAGWLNPTQTRVDVTKYEYNHPVSEGPTRIVPPRTAEAVTIGYDAYGRRQAVTDGRGKTTTLHYTPDGMLEQVVSPTDHPLVYGYHPTTRNLQTVTQGPVGQERTTTYVYAPNGVELQSTSDGTSITSVELDSIKRVRRTQTGAEFMVYEYDDAARTVRQLDAANRATTWTYDVLGRPLTECRLSGCIRTAYHGPIVTSTSRDGGGSTTLKYDPNGRPSERTTYRQGLTDVVVTAYDQYGNVSSVINRTFARQLMKTPYAQDRWRTPSKISRKHDAYGRVICEQQVLQELRDTTRFHGVAGWYVYDMMGRRERNIYSGAISCDRQAHIMTEELEDAQPFSPATWNLMAPPRMPTHGLLNPADSVTYKYDLAGNLQSLNHRPFARENPVGGTWTWTYDDEGRVTDVTSPLGRSQQSWRDYSDFGDLVGYGAAGWTSFTFSQHDAAGRAWMKEELNGRRTFYQFDESRRLRKEADSWAPSNPDSLVYDALGNIKRRGRLKYLYGGADLPAANQDRGRLLQTTDTVSQSETLYRYDQVGNEVKSGSPGFVTGTGAPTRAGDRDQHYTARGQLHGSRTAVTYHQSNNYRCTGQTHAPLGVEERLFEYDGLGRRVLEVSTHGCAHDYGVSRYFWLDGQVVVKTVNFLLDVAPVTTSHDTTFTLVADAEQPVEHTQTGIPTLLGQWFVYGPGIDNVLGVRNGIDGVPTAGTQMIRSRTHLYMVQDERGSVVRSVCREFNSTTACQGPSNGSYTAFGQATDPSAAATSMPGYNGHQATAGLVYMRNRWYDPNTGRFTQEDPIGYAGGSNLYAYAGNDPLTFSDPYGLSPDSTCNMSTGGGCSDHVKKLIAEDGGGMETPLVDPVRILTGAAAGAIVRQIGKTAVYAAVEDGVVKYVGITDNLLARAAAHVREKGISIEAIPGLSNLPRLDARGVEQVLIERFGLGKDGGSLLNKINSISPSNGVYNSAVARGRELLNQAGF